MALTLVKKEKNMRLGNQAEACVAEITFDSIYPTNGESLTAAQLGVTSLSYVKADDTDNYTFVYNYTSSKLKAFARTTGEEAANHANLSTVVTNVLAIGS